MKSEVQSVIFLKSHWKKKDATKELKNMGFTSIKPVHETENSYRYRIKNPEAYMNFRMKKLTPKGIELVLGLK